MASGSVVGGNGGNEGFREKPKLKESKVYTRKSFKCLKTDVTQPQTGTLASEEANSSQQQVLSRFDAASVDSSSLNHIQALNGGTKLGFPRQENRVTINLVSKSKKEVRELRRKLQGELDLVRNLVRKIETNGCQKAGSDVDNCVGPRKRVHSEVEAMGPLQSRPLHQLSISVLENSQGVNDNVEKEKRTPKANQFYRNTEFLLAKDKFPPADKKSKSNGKKQGGSEMGFGLGKFSNQLVKSCNALVERLMKHKHGWVFNKPVDAKALGLHDYFDIIKHPMDLGTIKSRLSKNWYKTPREFAEDVRLTFHNAMTYNPKGQDVYLMADQLLQLFEEKWDVIEADYLRELKLVVDHEGSLPTPTSRKAHTARQPSLEMKRVLERSESVTHSPDLNTKIVNFAHSGRSATPKKPKAKDINKREMTNDEKQKLSTNLQSLPAEKLEYVVQIIKKRNSSLCQHDDEIEVDIDSFDTETLWELDRFITNHKKGLSKNKKKTELANKAKPVAEKSVHKEKPAPVVVEAPKETKTDKEDTSTSSPIRVAKQVNDTTHTSKSGSYSSSSSGSGSSSSDSDSESSSG